MPKQTHLFMFVHIMINFDVDLVTWISTDLIADKVVFFTHNQQLDTLHKDFFSEVY